LPLVAGKDVRVGRASTADVSIDSSSLSRDHAVFRLRDGGVEVEDLGSSNGTVVRGEKLAPKTATLLAVG